ncbi:MAG: thiolase family protein [Acidobacteriota bacterium]|jgi:acetyl-CoA C-acetyltransferase/acetyl-CoA acyltransferase
MQPAAEAFVVHGARTPFAKSGTDLASVPAHELMRVVLREALERSGFRPEEVDEVIVGNIAQPAEATNLARVAALLAGVPERVSAFTVNRNCASAMQAIADAARRVRAGDARVVLAGGTESMSRIPLLFSEEAKAAFFRLFRARSAGARLSALLAFRPRHFKPVVALEVGLTDHTCGLNMGETAELLAREFGISREEQDAFALESHRRATEAWTAGRLAEEVVPVAIPPRYRKLVARDVGPRENQTLEALAKLRPYFDRRYGTVTVGNACPVTDGAVAVVVASEELVRERGLPALGRIRSWGFAGLDPARMGLGPVYASAIALGRAGLPLDAMEVVEINEAFAAQVLACLQAFESADFARRHLDRDEPLGRVDPGRLNVNGGAIALGHPVGATGARLVLTLLMEMARRGARHGLATLCIGGGQGGAMVLERPEGMPS